MTNLVSVPGRNSTWSQCGIGLNIEKPRIRYRPSSDFTWMSLITSGVKMLLCPSTARPPSSLVLISWASPLAASPWPGNSEDELALGRLKVVVVPELPAADELAERRRALQPVYPELAVQELIVAVGQLGLHAVDTE